MVPHVKIEEILSGILSGDDQESEDGVPEIRVAVTSINDPKKGERIIVVHKALSIPLEQVRGQLAESGLPNLWIPDAKSFIEVDQIPVLGTGKLDLKALKQLAEAKLATKRNIARSA